MKLRTIMAMGLLIATLVSVDCVETVGVEAFEVTSEEKAAKYKFLQESRSTALAQKEAFIDAVSESISTDISDESEDPTDIQVYFDRLAKVQAKKVKDTAESERQRLVAELTACEKEGGIPFASPELWDQQQHELINIVNKAASAIEKTTKTVEVTTEKNDTEYHGSSLESSGTDDIHKNDSASEDTDGASRQEWDSTDLAEIALCQATPNNVPDDVAGCNSTCRSYMSYTAVTCETSAQYALLNSEYAYSDKETGIRMYKGRYCIALGQGYTKTIGTKVDLVLEDGTIWKCVLGECKATKDTNPEQTFCKWDGSVAEFVVDMKYFNRNTERNPINTVLGNHGRILKVVVID